MKILVIEDEEAIADALIHMLIKNKYLADACYDGESGLDNALTGIYDLIILDIMLPKINGLDVLKQIRNQHINCPVILLTAKDEISDKVTGLDYGPEVGSIYKGKVVRIMSFGAFVEIAPGKDGLVHISKLDKARVEKVEDVVSIGDEIVVKVVEIDKQGRINLSRKDALADLESKKNQ